MHPTTLPLLPQDQKPISKIILIHMIPLILMTFLSSGCADLQDFTSCRFQELKTNPISAIPYIGGGFSSCFKKEQSK